MNELTVYDVDGKRHYYFNVHQIIDEGEVILIIYTDVKDSLIKCSGHDKVDIINMKIKI